MPLCTQNSLRMKSSLDTVMSFDESIHVAVLA